MERTKMFRPQTLLLLWAGLSQPLSVLAEPLYSSMDGAAPKDRTFSFDNKGWTTLTHYDYPLDFTGSCGCASRSSRYPVAALNALALGTKRSYGASCGSCARLTLVSTLNDPAPPQGTGWNYGTNNNSAPSIVVKVTDQCPISPNGSGSPCNATKVGPNAWGSYIHFDLAWPAAPGSGDRNIPDNWFPNHDHDYGTWNATYEFVSCQEWAGYQDTSALGSAEVLGNAGCCPTDPPLPSSDDFGLLSYNPDVEPETCPNYALVKSGAVVPDTIWTTGSSGSVTPSKSPSATSTRSSTTHKPTSRTSSTSFVPSTKSSSVSSSTSWASNSESQSEVASSTSSSRRSTHPTSPSSSSATPELSSSVSLPSHPTHIASIPSSSSSHVPHSKTKSECRRPSPTPQYAHKRRHYPHNNAHGLPPLLGGYQ